ncbi:MAG: hypothetical protein MJZ05_00070 [Fibrobacter sp.]|nr:hypothetical protein [Fibrobacter sp.]
MKKKFLGMFLLLALIAGFTACSGKGAAKDDCIDDITSTICKDKQDPGMDDFIVDDSDDE